jgi:hypothetical protein
MTEQDAGTEQMPTSTIEFQGRAIEVVLPDPGQMLVWKRTLTNLQSANLTDWTGAQMMKALERLRLIIDSIIVNEADKEWIDDQLLAKKFTIRELSEIPTKAAEAFATTPNNREERRAAKKAGPARRVPAKKTTATGRKKA